MTRNTVRRVEVAAPVLNEKLKERLDWMFETMMNDDEKGKRLTETGNYADRSLNDVKLNSQAIYNIVNKYFFLIFYFSIFSFFLGLLRIAVCHVGKLYTSFSIFLHDK